MSSCTTLAKQTEDNNVSTCTTLTTTIEKNTDVSTSGYTKKSRFCEGIIPHRKKDSNHKKLFYFVKYATIQGNSSYYFGTLSGDTTLFSKNYKTSEAR